MKETYKFSSTEPIEKFIMDFEMLSYLRKEMDCIVKGGMAVPFHIIDGNARRLSVDIDIVTTRSEVEVEQIVSRIRTSGIKPRIRDRHKPKAPKRVLPLAMYPVNYDSPFGHENNIKIEIFFDFKYAVATRVIPSNTEIFAFKTWEDIEIFDKGTLISDKLTTLPLNTIGICKEERAGDITKQIYDIASLIKQASKQDIDQIAKHYKIFVNTQNNYEKQPFPLEAIANDMCESLDSMLDQTGYLLNSEYSALLDSFKNYLLAKKNKYLSTEHITNILLIRLLAEYLFQLLLDRSSVQDVTDQYFFDITNFNEIKELSSEKKNETRKTMITKMQTITGRTIKPPSAEQAFLLSRIFELRKST